MQICVCTRLYKCVYGQADNYHTWNWYLYARGPPEILTGASPLLTVWTERPLTYLELVSVCQGTTRYIEWSQSPTSVFGQTDNYNTWNWYLYARGPPDILTGASPSLTVNLS